MKKIMKNKEIIIKPLEWKDNDHQFYCEEPFESYIESICQRIGQEGMVDSVMCDDNYHTIYTKYLEDAEMIYDEIINAIIKDGYKIKNAYH